MGRYVPKLKSLCVPTRHFACTGLAAMGLGDWIKQGGAWLTGANNAVILHLTLVVSLLTLTCSINIATIEQTFYNNRTR